MEDEFVEGINLDEIVEPMEGIEEVEIEFPTSMYAKYALKAYQAMMAV